MTYIIAATVAMTLGGFEGHFLIASPLSGFFRIRVARRVISLSLSLSLSLSADVPTHYMPLSMSRLQFPRIFCRMRLFCDT